MSCIYNGAAAVFFNLQLILQGGVQRNVVYQNFPPPQPPPPKKDNNSNNSNSYQCCTNNLLTRSSKTNYERTTGELTI